MRKRGAGGQLGGHGLRFDEQIAAVVQRVEEAPGQSFLRRHRAAGEQQLARAPLPDHPRQQRAGAHVGAGQTDAGEQESRLGLVGSIAQVASQRHHRARTGTDAIDGADDGLRAAAHGFHQIARHACEFQQLGHRHFGQRANDVVHVAARAEVAALARHHHHLDVGRVAQAVEQVAQLAIAVEGERVLALGSVEADGADAVRVAVPGEVFRLVGRAGVELGAHGVARADVVLHAVS